MTIDSHKYPLPKRLRHHTSPSIYLPANELFRIPDYYPPLIEKIDWKDYFSNGFPPNSIDVGCGKAKLLLDFAELHPKKNVLGIEIRKPLVAWANNVIKSENIANAMVIWYSIANGFPFIENNSISDVFYLFPDPWPKTKHAKRRVLNISFLNEIERILKDDGKLYIATDLEEIHQYHFEILTDFKKFKFDLANEKKWHLPITNKETFCLEKSIEVYKIIASKK